MLVVFPLRRTTLPDSADELGGAIEAALREVVDKPGQLVRATGASSRELAALVVDLNGAAITRMPPPFTKAAGEGESLRVERLSVEAANVSVFGAHADFTLNGDGVELAAARDASGDIVLLPRSAANGIIEFSIGKAALVELLQRFGREEAARHGVTLDSIDVNWRSRGPRAIDLEVRLRGRKFFMSAALQLSGSVDIDEQFAAKLSNLRCTGDGAVANIVCGVLTPQLRKIEEQRFTLSMLPIGELQLRDVQLEATDQLRVSAKFGT